MSSSTSTLLVLVLVVVVLCVQGAAERAEVAGGAAVRKEMVMAHDAATTYLSGDNVVTKWAQTQPPGGFAKLLDCGARFRSAALPASGWEAYHGSS